MPDRQADHEFKPDMTSLTATYSEALGELIQSSDPPIDGIEIGPWYSVDEIQQIQHQFSSWPFQFHAGSVLTRWRLWPGAKKQLNRYLDVAQGKWISVHLELLPWHVYLLSAHLGIHLDPPPPSQVRDHFLKRFNRFSNSVDLPILLENLPSLPVEKYNYAADPELATQIVNKTDTGMVLDIAHARIAASFQKRDIEAYLSALPLDRVRQIHVSGVRQVEGQLHDSHEILEALDYDLLKWALERTQPQVVTLEYFRDRKALRDQLQRLGDILG